MVPRRHPSPDLGTRGGNSGPAREDRSRPGALARYPAYPMGASTQRSRARKLAVDSSSRLGRVWGETMR